MRLPRLRDLPVAIRLWAVMILILIPCLVVISLSFRSILSYTRDESIFASIRQAQQLLKQGGVPTDGGGGLIPPEYDAVTSVYHIGIVNRQVQYMTFPSSKFQGVSVRFIDLMGSSYSRQTAATQKYKLETDGYTLYYIILRAGGDGVISFRADPVDNTVYREAYRALLLVAGGAAALSLLLAFLFARTLSRPLRKLAQRAGRMASGDLDTPVGVDRGDEIGRLSQELEKARVELKRRDLLRQGALQYVSHELKTPIMTIESYAQSIVDGVFPSGGPEGSARVIAGQAQRLRATVMKLLTIARLEYLESRPPVTETFDLAGTAEDVCGRLGAQRPDIALRLELEDTVMRGPRDEIAVLCENLVENALRHAGQTVVVSVGRAERRPFLRVFNDGGGIDEALLPGLFEVFRKGEKGVTGLGLSIVRRIADSCGADISAKNTGGGVQFEVLFAPDPAEKGNPA